MTTSTGFTGRGVYLTLDGVEVANVKTIGGPDGREAEEIDFTHLRSDAGYRELRQGFKDPGTITLGLQFDPVAASHANGAGSLEALLTSGDIVDFVLHWEDAGKAANMSGECFVKGFSFNHDPDNAVEGTATLRLTGATTMNF